MLIHHAIAQGHKIRLPAYARLGEDGLEISARRLVGDAERVGALAQGFASSDAVGKAPLGGGEAIGQPDVGLRLARRAAHEQQRETMRPATDPFKRFRREREKRKRSLAAVENGDVATIAQGTLHCDDLGRRLHQAERAHAVPGTKDASSSHASACRK